MGVEFILHAVLGAGWGVDHKLDVFFFSFLFLF